MRRPFFLSINHLHFMTSEDRVEVGFAGLHAQDRIAANESFTIRVFSIFSSAPVFLPATMMGPDAS